MVLGASPDSSRYSYRAIISLIRHGHPVVAIGIRDGKIHDVEIVKEKIPVKNLHTVTIYLNPDVQDEYVEYVLSLNPVRIIFNPGTYNDEFAKSAEKKGISILERCTLMLLSSGEF